MPRLRAVTLTPGTNTFSVYAVDNNGSHSLTNTVKIFYVVTTALTVLTNGNGSITPAYNGAQLAIGAMYSMKATPGKGTAITAQIPFGPPARARADKIAKLKSTKH